MCINRAGDFITIHGSRKTSSQAYAWSRKFYLLQAWDNSRECNEPLTELLSSLALCHDVVLTVAWRFRRRGRRGNFDGSHSIYFEMLHGEQPWFSLAANRFCRREGFQSAGAFQRNCVRVAALLHTWGRRASDLNLIGSRSRRGRSFLLEMGQRHDKAVKIPGHRVLVLVVCLLMLLLLVQIKTAVVVARLMKRRGHHGLSRRKMRMSIAKVGIPGIRLEGFLRSSKTWMSTQRRKSCNIWNTAARHLFNLLLLQAIQGWD